MNLLAFLNFKGGVEVFSTCFNSTIHIIYLRMSCLRSKTGKKSDSSDCDPSLYQTTLLFTCDQTVSYQTVTVQHGNSEWCSALKA